MMMKYLAITEPGGFIIYTPARSNQSYEIDEFYVDAF